MSENSQRPVPTSPYQALLYYDVTDKKLDTVGSKSWTPNQASQPDLAYGREEHRTLSEDLLEPGLQIKESLESGYRNSKEGRRERKA
ncbi:unnamed protein product [Caretta caretta]